MKHILCPTFVVLLLVHCVQAAEVPFIELRGHTENRSAYLSPDGQKIVTVNREYTVQLWEAESGEELHTWKGMFRVFLPGEKVILAAGWDKDTGIEDTRIWEIDSGKEYVFPGRWGQIFHDGKKVATTTDHNVHIWDTESRRELFVLSGRLDSFSPDGKTIITSVDNTARIWDGESGKELRKLEGRAGFVHSAFFSPDGLKIVTESGGDPEDDMNTVYRTVQIWDAESGEELYTLKGWVRRFFKDGQIVTEDGTGTVHVRDANSGKVVYALKGWFIVFSPDEKKIVTRDAGTSRIWDAESGKELLKL